MQITGKLGLLKLKKTRTLLNTLKVEELDKNIILQVKTNMSSKWLLTDMETGESYIGQDPVQSQEHQVYWRKVKKEDNA